MLPRLRSLWHALRARTRFEQDMDDELRFHLERRAEDLVRAGLPRERAIRQARLEFGNPEAYQDLCRESRGLHLADDLRLDLRFARRNIRKDASLSATVVVTLALGIGATTAIFSIVNSVLFRPLPLPNPERLMIAGTVDSAGRLQTVFGPDFVEWRARCGLCEHVAASAGSWPGSLVGGTEPDRVRIGRVSDGFFAAMGERPILGRTFLPAETGRPLFGDSSGSPITAVILSHGLWQGRFGADRNIVGRAVRIEGDAATVIGVMPEGFDFPDKTDAWVPATINTKRDNAFLRVLVRLRPGATQAGAQAEIQAIAQQIDLTVGDRNGGTAVRLLPLQEFMVGEVRSSLLVLLGAVSFVLLIACANVANLLLAQAATRPKEMAIRIALGATRFRVLRQLLTESLVLSAAGGALGLALSVWILRAFIALAPAVIPRLDTVSIDGHMLGFTAGVSLLTGILFGLAPVIRASKPDLNASLQEGGARAAGSAGRNRTRKLLVVSEVAMALVLLIGAGLLGKSFIKLQRTPTGFDPANTLTAAVTLPESTYPDTARVKGYYREALQALSMAPGVQAAGIVSALPLGVNGARILGDLTVEGEATERPDLRALKLAVGGDYFRAAGIPLVSGRLFDERETDASPGVLIISESLARNLWPNQEPLGRRLNIGFLGETWREVVGIVDDIRQEQLGEPPSPAVYQPYAQVAAARRWMLGDMTFVVRTAGPPESFAPALRGALARIDGDLPLYDVAIMTDIVAMQIADPRFYTLLLGSFSLLALALAAAGLYGLLCYSVTQRTHEIGLRLALGAGRNDVLRLVVGEGMRLVAAGTVIGVAGAFALTRVLSRFLYAVSVTDSPTFAGIVALLACVAAMACYLPARRAMAVDPLGALRQE